MSGQKGRDTGRNPAGFGTNGGTTPTVVSVTAPSSPLHPRDYFVAPGKFGRPQVAPRADLGQEATVKDRLRAARWQNTVIITVRILLREQGFSMDELADSAGISRRRLTRIVSGSVWIQMYGLTALSRVLGAELFTVGTVDSMSLDISWTSEQPKPPPLGVDPAVIRRERERRQSGLG